MRQVGGLVLGLVLVGWILTEIPVAPTEAPAAAPEWKRTVDGWERATTWYTGPRVRHARLHPAVLGAMELLISLMALLAVSGLPRPAASEAAPGPSEPRHAGPHRAGSHRRVSGSRSR